MKRQSASHCIRHEASAVEYLLARYVERRGSSISTLGVRGALLGKLIFGKSAFPGPRALERANFLTGTVFSDGGWTCASTLQSAG